MASSHWRICEGISGSMNLMLLLCFYAVARRDVDRGEIGCSSYKTQLIQSVALISVVNMPPDVFVSISLNAMT